MSQDKILQLLKVCEKGLTAKQIHEMLQVRNCYAQLKKMERYGEVHKVDGVRPARWKICV